MSKSGICRRARTKSVSAGPAKGVVALRVVVNWMSASPQRVVKSTASLCAVGEVRVVFKNTHATESAMQNDLFQTLRSGLTKRASGNNLPDR